MLPLRQRPQSLQTVTIMDRRAAQLSWARRAQVSVRWSNEDERFVASVPLYHGPLSGDIAHGDTVGMAHREALEALAALEEPVSAPDGYVFLANPRCPFCGSGDTACYGVTSRCDSCRRSFDTKAARQLAPSSPPQHLWANVGSRLTLKCVGCGVSSLDPRHIEPCPTPAPRGPSW
jgi:hypothetical protein